MADVVEKGKYMAMLKALQNYAHTTQAICKSLNEAATDCTDAMKSDDISTYAAGRMSELITQYQKTALGPGAEIDLLIARIQLIFQA